MNGALMLGQELKRRDGESDSPSLRSAEAQRRREDGGRRGGRGRLLREESEAVGAGGGVGAVQVWGDVSAEAKDLVRSMMTVTAHAAATRRTPAHAHTR